MVLLDVAQGDPHVAAHNDEREAINANTDDVIALELAAVQTASDISDLQLADIDLQAAIDALVATGGTDPAAIAAIAGDEMRTGGLGHSTINAADINAALAGPFGYYGLPNGVTEVIGIIKIAANSTLAGYGATSVLRLQAGQPQIDAFITNADNDPVAHTFSVAGTMSGIGLRAFTLDGNGSAGGSFNSPGGASLRIAGIYLLRTPALHVEGVHIVNCTSNRAFYMDGAGVGDNRDHVINSMFVYENHSNICAWGVSQTSRQTQVNNLQVFRNITPVAIWFDVSQMQVNGAYAYLNDDGVSGGTGIHINNVHSSTYQNLNSIDNGGDGIVVEELVRCSGGNWKSAGNGRLGTPGVSGYAEVRFNNLVNQSLGITRDSTINGIDVSTQIAGGGVTSGYRYADFGLVVEDGVTQHVNLLNVQLGIAGQMAKMKLPAVMGELRVTLVDGTCYPDTAPTITNLFTKDPAMANVVTATTDWTFQNATGSVDTINLPDGTTVKALKAVANAVGAHNISTKPTADVPVTPGLPYAWSAGVKAEAAITDIATTGTWFDAGGVSLGVVTADIRPSTRGLTRFGATAVAPAGAATLRVKWDARPQGDIATAAFWVTQIMVVQGLYTPENYFDGDSGDGNAWTGSARNSTSTKVGNYSPAKSRALIDANTAALASRSRGGLIATSWTQTVVGATTAETELLRLTVPAARLLAGDLLTVEFEFDVFDNNTAINYVFKYKLGGTTVHTTQSISYAAATGRFPVTSQAIIGLAALNDQRWGIKHLGGGAANGNGQAAANSSIKATTSAEDLTTDKDFVITVTPSVSTAGMEVKAFMAAIRRDRIGT